MDSDAALDIIFEISHDIYIPSSLYTCANLRNQEPLFFDSFVYMPFPIQTLPQTLELKELTPNKLKLLGVYVHKI